MALLTRGLRLLGIFVGLGLLLFGGVVAALAVPDAPIRERLRAEQGSFPNTLLPAPLSGRLVDTVTECLGLGMGLAPRGAATSVERAVIAPAFACDELHKYLNGAPARSWNYFRYWHGYMVLTRPWLALASYASLQLAWAGALVVLLLFWVSMTTRRMGIDFALAFFLPFLAFPLDTVALSVLHGGCWAIAAGLGMAVLTGWGRRRAPELFLVAGMLAAYWDLLTNPLVTFGLPAVIYLAALAREDGVTGRAHLLACLTCFAAWSVGFFGFWIVKFAIGIHALGDAAATRLSEVISYRLRGGAEEGIKITLFSSILGNLSYIAWWGLIAPIPVLIWTIRDRLALPRRLPNLPGLYILLPLPFLWFAVLANHSQIHSFFTYKIALVSAAALYVLVFWAVPSGVAAAPPRCR